MSGSLLPDWRDRLAPRAGDWMQTASDLAFWPLDPRADEVHIYDIAHALSNLCRFGGHCQCFYSVAEHSVHVSRVVPREHALAALLHDATEAYCVDVPRPLKRFLPGYAAIEARIWLAIAERFAVPAELPACVKQADDAVLLAEKAQILGPSPLPWDWAVGMTPAPVQIAGYAPADARHLFLQRFAELTQC